MTYSERASFILNFTVLIILISKNNLFSKVFILGGKIKIEITNEAKYEFLIWIPPY